MVNFKRILGIIIILALLTSSAPFFGAPVVADEEKGLRTNPFEEIFIDEDGNELIRAVFPLPPPDIKVEAASVPEVRTAGAINTISDVPAFDWSYGCSATAAAMLFGYYDRTGYDNMYTGPANGGVCPLDNSTWGTGECPISASHQGIDSRAARGHVDDYWISYGSAGPDPWVGSWAEHAPGDCTADYMGTNQWKYGSPVEHNIDGGTLFYFDTTGDPLPSYTGAEPAYRDGCHGMKLFAESRGYTVVENFSQLIQGQGTDLGKGFTFADFQAEIDAGRPVLIQVSNPTVGGHTMLGYGYDDTVGEIIYVHDTWDYSSHTMTWGETYPYGAQQLQHYGVTVIRLQATTPTVTSVDPDSAGQGQTLDATIYGANFTGATGISFGAGITVNSFTEDSAAQITADITIDGGATPGTRDVSVTTPEGTGTLTDGFEVVTNEPPNPPASPLCEGMTNPSEVTNPTPEFSWTFSDPDGGDTQRAYQILVASSSGNLGSDIGDIWDSGQVSSSAGEVPYAGTTLADDQTYYWKVKTWDNHAAEGPYCGEQQFTTLLPVVPQKLIGVDEDTPISSAFSGNYFVLYRFQAIETGDVTTFKIKASSWANSHFKVAIYDDDAGEPGFLLSAVNTSTSVSAGWNDIAITSTPVVAGDYYWLAYNSDNNLGYFQNAPGEKRYKPSPYPSFSFPDSAGTNFSSASNRVGIMAGWGIIVYPTAPTVTNSTGASNITSGSARLNGEITDTGGENPTVHIYWGDNDGGTTPSSWDNDINLGTQGAGTFYADISDLTADTNYYYRCYAENSVGRSWAASTEPFTTTPPPPPVQDYYCDSVSVNVGSITSGNHTRLHDDDGSYLQILYASYGWSKSIDWYGETVIDQSPEQVDELSITYDGKYSQSLAQKLYLYNFNRSLWDEIDSRTVGASDTTITWSTTSPIEYISTGGEIRLRVYAKTTREFTCYGDLLKFTIGSAA